ncbi:Cytochrome b6 [Hyella patelloides LEGE 07179]|uniref:Cytochrome b6 n=1 Tax=Hyella patelloides LEGE 07179 TaxID=945734 RepID=A0A563VQV9_9CYAN|nr:cytochrome b N-terminal domain-containing protein [Hyella patelloides]VEP13657.1 Cytochrome b6 [Hyella patelloides LEGE 07179]
MSSQDLELASRIGELVSHFSEEWEEYQDWLRDIISSRLVLRERYPAWQTVVIFHWRLLYFVAYVGIVMVVNRLLKKLKSFLLEKDFLNFTILSERVATVTQLLGIARYRYILQRTATLLAVVELTLCGIAAFTGILLAFYYQPTALGAYNSLTMIVEEVTNGSLILSLHNLAGHSLIVLALVQIVVMFLGRRFLLSWLTAWISGICLTLTAIGLSWTAIVLNWEQTSFWRFKIELSIVASIPLVGSNLRDILSGGNGISSLTLQHMYALHSYILAVVAIILSITHLTALICQEQNWKPENKKFRLMQLCNKYVSNEESSSV